MLNAAHLVLEFHNFQNHSSGNNIHVWGALLSLLWATFAGYRQRRPVPASMSFIGIYGRSMRILWVYKDKRHTNHTKIFKQSFQTSGCIIYYICRTYPQMDINGSTPQPLCHLITWEVWDSLRQSPKQSLQQQWNPSSRTETLGAAATLKSPWQKCCDGARWGAKQGAGASPVLRLRYSQTASETKWLCPKIECP